MTVVNGRVCYAVSLPVRGAWVEIATAARITGRAMCRSPCGERGLKSCAVGTFDLDAGRSPCGERGLKLDGAQPTAPAELRRSPCGERGLKFKGACPKTSRHFGRSPCGERGLKYKVYDR